MNAKFRQLRIKQLNKQIEQFSSVRGVPRPWKGWIAAIREASGISLRGLAAKLHTPHQAVAALEKSEAEDRITLKKLRQVADALECELVYALVPKSGSIRDVAEAKCFLEIEKRVRSVEHSMALENQAVGDVEAKIKEEIQFLRQNERH